MPTRRLLIRAGAGAAALSALPPLPLAVGPGIGTAAAHAAALERLTVHGMPATPAVLLARAVRAGALDGLVGRADFAVWRTPDALRAGVARGDMRAFAAMAYAGANLRNRGVPLVMVDVLSWGMLFVVTTDPVVRRLADLAGRTVTIGYRGDAPDLITRYVLSRDGLLDEVDLAYAATSVEVARLMLAGRVRTAVLPAQAAALATLRGAERGIAARWAVDLTEAFGRVTGGPPRIAQVGLCVTEDLAEAHPEVVAALHAGAAEAVGWALDDPQSAGDLGAEVLGLDADVIAASIPRFRLAATPSAEARSEIERYLSALAELSPDIVGGRLPDAGFYWHP